MEEQIHGELPPTHLAYGRAGARLQARAGRSPIIQMAEIPWYSLYIGDYQQKTAHLSLIEHGAYRLLIDHYYSTAHALPSEHKILYRICRAEDRNERRAIDRILDQFFTKTEPNSYRRPLSPVVMHGIFYVNKRCELEITKRLNYSKSQSTNVSKRYKSGSYQTSTEFLPARASSLSLSLSEKKGRKENKTTVTRGTSFLLDVMPDEWKIFCKDKRPDLDPAETFAEFGDYWRGVPGQRGRKLDWFATWRNRVRDKKKTNNIAEYISFEDRGRAKTEAAQREIERRFQNES